MAGTTGFEPATSDVTGRRSNQLSYVPANCRNPQNTMIVERIARQLPLRIRKFQPRSQFPLCQSSPQQILRLLPCVANLLKLIAIPPVCQLPNVIVVFFFSKAESWQSMVEHTLLDRSPPPGPSVTRSYWS